MKVETSLTPKQAVLLWLADAQKQSFVDYGASLLEQGEPPREHVGRAIETAVRAAMKGRDKDIIARAVQQAQQEGDLLVCIVLEANQSVLHAARADALQAALLTEQMKGILELDSVSNEMLRVWMFLSNETAYPLDPDTAAAYAWMRGAWVQTETLYRDDIENWVREHFIRQGKTRIPADARPVGGGRRPLTDDELLPIFNDPAALAAYQSGSDYSHELADVPDAEFETLLKTLDNALDALVANKALATGTAVELELPTDATWMVPLLDDDWLDRTFVELAEWHAALLADGWQTMHPDGHDLAWHAYERPGATPDDDPMPATDADLDAVRATVRARLAKFKGRTRTKDGRTFLSFADYQGWKARAVKTLKTKPGILAASWRDWIDAHGGPDRAELAGVRVAPFETFPRQGFVAVADAHERRTKQTARAALFERIRPWLIDKSDIEGAEYIADRRRDALFARLMPFGLLGFKTRIADWRVRAMAHASEVFRLRGALDRLQKKYFDGQPILFPDVADDLKRQVELLQTVVGVFNETIAHRLHTFLPGELLTGEKPTDFDAELPSPLRSGFKIDLQDVAQLIEPYIDARADQIVQAARAKTLQNADLSQARAHARRMLKGEAE